MNTASRYPKDEMNRHRPVQIHHQRCVVHFFLEKSLIKWFITYKVINLPLSFKSSTNRIHLHKDKKVHSQTEGPHKETPTSPRLEYGLEIDIIKTAK